MLVEIRNVLGRIWEYLNGRFEMILASNSEAWGYDGIIPAPKRDQVFEIRYLQIAKHRPDFNGF